MSSTINYAKAYGIDSIAGAIIFTILYIPFLALYVFQGIRRRTRVYFSLTLFCLIRVVAFALRSALAGSTAAATDENVFIAYEVIYNIGFFGVLYSAYTLVLERESLVDMDTILMYCPGPLQLIFRITRRRSLVRIMLIVAVAIGIAGITDITNAKSEADVNEGTSLRSASVYIFLAVTCLLVVQALALSVATMRTLDKEIHAGQQQSYGRGAPGETFGIFVLLAISALLLAREAFYAATTHKTAQQTNEHLWYPLSALTEFIAIALFAVPGLIPAQDELPQEEREMNLLA
ncbi:uncharacterized protein C8Q71DRAFT_773771 [Rhodofomes roseus]|uniref:DUF7702 domain-containing protein n=1 Tax=Rhodofomes roseus TaxID=34475 RepID=A0A4Y9YPE5_9APHY|nr:uncharacterized protein C8Q71DRAFT_773771 [Rhodofomes roseus]KAH9833500.1 hypothetical protein C8Q71DRAFT_773771 [Rhodofomes roseus]TFY63658.1 hypothetical protein EVJ58_g3120 [Rhodofomes roseus]